MSRVLIFDMDGVVVDNDLYHFRSWQDYAKTLGKVVSFEEVKSWFGSTNQVILENLLGKHVSSKEIEQHARRKEKHYREIYRQDIQPVKGLKSFLELAQKENFRIGLATSAPPENVDFVLSSTGLTDFFEVITDDTQINSGKPDPEIFLKTAKKLQASPSGSIVFEDSFHGIEAARRAGMYVIGVATTHELENLVHADLQITDFTELTISILENLLGEKME